MTEDTAQEIRAVLAKWTANDWRRAFAQDEGLEPAIRRVCEVPAYAPLTSNTGALAMPVLRRLGTLDLPELQEALAPLVRQLARHPVDDPGLAALAALHLAPAAEDDLPEVEELQPAAVEAASRVLAATEAGRPAAREDLSLLETWSAGAERTETTLAEALRDIAAAELSPGARDVLAGPIEEAAGADPAKVSPQQRDVFLALHRLLARSAWEVSDADVELVEEAYGRQVARVAVAEDALPGQ